jgi:hypothetical protein
MRTKKQRNAVVLQTILKQHGYSLRKNNNQEVDDVSLTRKKKNPKGRGRSEYATKESNPWNYGIQTGFSIMESG